MVRTGNVGRALKHCQLRSSCNACAEAKVGCTKEKPACRRCVRRDELCVYAAARRAGRPSQNKQQGVEGSTDRNDSTATSSSSTQQSTQPPEEKGEAMSLLLRSPSLTQSPLEQFVLDHANFFSVMKPTTEASQLNVPSTLSPALSDFPAALEPESTSTVFFAGGPPGSHLVDSDKSPEHGSNNTSFEADIFNLDFNFDALPASAYLGHDTATSGGPRTNLFPTIGQLGDLGSALSTPSTWLPFSHWSLITSHPTHSTEVTSLQPAAVLASHSPTGTGCGCLTRGLNLLDQLTPHNITGTCSTESASTWPSFAIVMARNGTTLEEMKSILDCSCSRNSSLLHVLTSIVLKVVGWYAATGCAISSEGRTANPNMPDVPSLPQWGVQPPLANTLGQEVEGEHQDRILYQHVLSKLYSVQSIVSVLSVRLLALEKQKALEPPSGNRMANTARELLCAGPMFNPSSSSALARDLEAELRSRFRDLCEAIVDTLQEW